MGIKAILVKWPGQFEHILISLAPRGSTWNSYNWPSGFRGDIWNFNTRRVLGQRSNNDLDLFYSQIFMYT